MPGLSDLANPNGVVKVTAAYTMNPGDAVISCTTGAGYTVTLLPATAVGAGTMVMVLKADATNATVTVSGGGTNINGAATSTLLTGAAYKSLQLVSNGTIWLIASQF